QPIHQVQIVMVRRPVQGRGAVRLSDIDLGAFFDQLTNGGTVHPLHRARERRIRLRASHFGGQVRSVRKRDDGECENDQQSALHVHPHPTRSTGLSSVSIFPVLSANESSRTPTLSSIVKCRFASGIGSS